VPETVDRRLGKAGELVLRRSGAHFEIIANGMFLMDSRDGTSERLLVRAAADRMPAGGAWRAVAAAGQDDRYARHRCQPGGR
jgi:hypothetical protein